MKTKTVIEYDEMGKKIRETIYNEEEAKEDFKTNQDKPPHSLDEIIEAEKEKIDAETRKRLKERMEDWYSDNFFKIIDRTSQVVYNKLYETCKKFDKTANIMIFYTVITCICMFFLIVAYFAKMA